MKLAFPSLGCGVLGEEAWLAKLQPEAPGNLSSECASEVLQEFSAARAFVRTFV